MARSAPLLRTLLSIAALALAYALLGRLALLLALPPMAAAPLYPPAGLALAAVLCGGPRLAWGVALGAFAVNVQLGDSRGQVSMLAPLLIAAGAALQALLGAAAVRRWVSQPLLLSEPADLLRFFILAAPLACVVSATVSAGALLLVGALDPALLGYHWLTWWVGDSLGVLIGAPVALTLLAAPREVWAPRRLSVGVPLVLASLLLALVTQRIAVWDEQRERQGFEREADNALGAMETALREPLHALDAVRGLLVVAPQLSRSDFERATASQLLPGGNLLALGWAALMPRDSAAEFERAARAEGFANYTVRDRGRSADVRTDPGEPALAIRLIEPLSRNAAALGVNIRSIRASRDATLRAARTALPSASAGFQLSQDSEAATVGVVIYQALYNGRPNTALERERALRGVAFATIRPDLLLHSVAASLPARLELCLVDTDPMAPHRILAGPADCDALPGGAPTRLRSIDFAGRAWDLRVFARTTLQPFGDRSGWAFALIGLLSTALLGALLLTITGRARRIEALVLERTSALQREVRQREQASMALAQSEQRFRNIFDNVPIGLVFSDLESRPREVNPRFCRMLGYTPEELLGKREIDLTHADDRDEDLRLRQELVDGHLAMYRRRKRFLARDGHVIHVNVLVTLLRDAEGHPDRLLSVVEDITDQLKMRELELAREAAEAASRAKNEFLSRMSHELRTPLNAMLGFTQLLDMDTQPSLSPRQKNWAAQVQHAGWHLLEMINDILDLSRIESGAVKLELTHLDLQPLVTSALSMVSKQAEQRRVKLTQRLDPTASHVWGDATRIRQVLTNLVSNAVKYNIEGGNVHVSSRRLDADTVEIVVTDTGLGLSQQQLDQLFQPFNRLGRETSGIEGTGIGLVIARRLAELMSGTLSATSIEGSGSSFALCLPRAEPPLAEASLAAPALAPAPATQQRRVIYIEDNAANVALMRGILAQRPQLQLQVYGDGQSGLEAVLADPPDLLLLDMQLPDGDGLELLHRLRAEPRCADLPVIAVSANALPDHVATVLAAGALRYLTKPVDVQDLLSTLDRVLGQA